MAPSDAPRAADPVLALRLSPVTYLLQKNMTVTLFHFIIIPRLGSLPRLRQGLFLGLWPTTVTVDPAQPQVVPATANCQLLLSRFSEPQVRIIPYDSVHGAGQPYTVVFPTR